eukprot:CAMPEP_0194501782 /NCGR_PEP_ID=MMETSP0253-20130528/23082_1 /TAXON_ID=2966 /ORGANISM="Noctiluca scintillans" /LENGTH=32 /DNA_ID= /DNA_START= /DNA_END= /DNA_ORIENTATION=
MFFQELPRAIIGTCGQDFGRCARNMAFISKKL